MDRNVLPAISDACKSSIITKKVLYGNISPRREISTQNCEKPKKKGSKSQNQQYDG